jgi:hypothetical protein
METSVLKSKSNFLYWMDGQFAQGLAICFKHGLTLSISLLISMCVITTTALSVDSVPQASILLKDRIPVVIGLEDRTEVGSLRVKGVIFAKVRRPVQVKNKVVIQSGSAAILTVKYVRKRGILGSPAKVILEASHIQIGDHQQISISGTWTFEGEDLSIEAISGGAAICCLGFFMPGGEVVLGKGSGFTAFIDGDQKLIIDNED